MDEHDLGAVFDSLEKLDSKEKDILASFERRIGSLYEHKKKVRSLIIALNNINGNWVSNDEKKAVISLVEGISRMLQEDFVSLDLQNESDSLMKINNKEKQLLLEDIKRSSRIYDDLSGFKNKKIGELMLKDLQNELLIEKEAESLHEKLSERLQFFRIYYTEQKKKVEEELKLLEEIRNLFSGKYVHHNSLTDSWCKNLKFYEEQIDEYLKKEKEDVHIPLDYLFEKTKRSKELSDKLFKKYWKDSLIKRLYHHFNPDLIIEAIRKDVQTFSRPEEFGEYKNKLDELFNYGFPKNAKIRLFLHRLDVSRTNAERGKTYAKNSLDILASLDSLTELPNRRKFVDIFLNEINRASRTNEPISLLMLDIDNFKMYNDSFSHKAGDAVLKSFSKIVKNNLRRSDIIGRWGGEEFVILLLDTDKKNAFHVADEIRRKVMEESRKTMEEIKKSYPIMKGDAEKFNDFEVSIGFSAYPDDIGNSDINYEKIFEALQHKADLELYEAKRERNCVRPNL